MKRTTLFKSVISFVLSCLFIMQIGIPSALANTAQYDDNAQDVSVTSNTSDDKNYEALIDGILKGIDAYPQESGVWINTSSREYFLQMVTNLSDQEYTVDQNGYLKQKTVNAETFNTYDEKLKELVEGNKTIIVALSSTYNAYNEAFDEVYSVSIEDGEFALLFEKDDNCSIVVLNYAHYAEHKDQFVYEDEYEYDETYYYSDEELMNNFLDVFYQGVDFVELTQNEQTQKEADALLQDDNEIQYTTPAPKLLPMPRSVNSQSPFDVAAYGIAGDVTTYASSGLSSTGAESATGIIIDDSSEDIVLNYLNIHGIYTYSVDSYGKLICDYVEKENPYLDASGETEVDKELKFVSQSGLSVYISVDDSYYSKQSNALQDVYLQSDEYVKAFMNEDNTQRILILNQAYFNMDMGYNPATSDRFVKNLYPEELRIQPYAANSSLDGATGTMNTARTVYFGPSSSNYAVVGSVEKNEDIAIMGKNAGWYFIVYIVGSTSTFKSGYVPASTVSSISGAVHEQNFTGGYNYSDSELDIKSCYLFDYAINNGTIYAEEGFTELQQYYEDGKWVSLVEFSTPSGTKRGFVNSSSMHIKNVYNSTVARVVASSSPAYAGPDNSYVKLGGVYENEFVAILAVNGKWAYSEYNTASGRKRGYIKYSDLDNYVVRSYAADKTHISLKKATKELSVYGGPNSNYANIGTVFNQEIVSYLGTERNYSYVEYTTANGAKRGYVPTSSLTNATVPAIPSIPTYGNFTSGTYGSSGNGKALKWYKLGSGKNVVFAVFEQHGWEDAWASDGIELVNIANTMMSKLSTMSQSTFSDWTIYVIPYANPDGITDGYTNNGPGRCTVSKKVDMNRCWPANFVPYYTSRNYTGATSLGAPEAASLKNFISSKFGNATNVVLDIHGWLNKTYGNSQVGSYFGQQFGFGHSNSHGNGYLETWAYLQGAKSCLVELPMPSSSASITSNNYAGKLTNALVNMIKNISGGSAPEGGTVVNELCEVSTNSSVNVRSGPGTSYTIVTSLKNGTRVTRIKKAVATANGYTWDKISLSDGRIGYMATNYLKLIQDDIGYIKYGTYDEIAVIKAYLKHETMLYTEGNVDQQYNNELIGAVEEYQKIYDLSTQDGSINDETLKRMGFSVNTNGKIINNTYYQKYLAIAKQFMYCGIFEDDADDPNKYIYDSSSTKFDAGYVENKRQGDNEWNSMGSDEKASKMPELTKALRDVQRAVDLYKDILPEASQALGRFVDSNRFGEKLYFNDIEEIYNCTSNLEGLYNKTIERNMRAAEKFTTYVNSSKFAQEYTIGSQVGFDISLDSLSIKRLNWFMAVNGFVYKTKGTVNKNGNKYEMDLTFEVCDYYDWASADEDPMAFPLFLDLTSVGQKPVVVLETINETTLNDMNRAGMGKNFESYGTFTLHVAWTSGQTYDQAVITT